MSYASDITEPAPSCQLCLISPPTAGGSEEGFEGIGGEEGGEGGWEMEVSGRWWGQGMAASRPRHDMAAACNSVECQQTPAATMACITALQCLMMPPILNQSTLLSEPTLLNRTWKSPPTWQPRWQPRQQRAPARAPSLWHPRPACRPSTAGRPSATWRRSRWRQAHSTPPCGCSRGGWRECWLGQQFVLQPG